MCWLSLIQITVYLFRIFIEEFGKEYGFSINRSAMTTLLNKCAKAGLIRKKKNATYDVILDKCDAVAINTHEVNLQYQKYNEVVNKLQRYYEEEYNISLNLHEVETLLMSVDMRKMVHRIRISLPLS